MPNMFCGLIFNSHLRDIFHSTFQNIFRLPRFLHIYIHHIYKHRARNKFHHFLGARSTYLFGFYRRSCPLSSPPCICIHCNRRSRDLDRYKSSPCAACMRNCHTRSISQLFPANNYSQCCICTLCYCTHQTFSNY